jgi:transcription antitermination factor NusA-like protein
MPNLNNLVTRIQKINYQFLNGMVSPLTDQEKVDTVLYILNGVLRDAPDGIIVDALMPATVLGIPIDWVSGATNDKIVTVSSGSVTSAFNLAQAYVSGANVNIAESMAQTIYDAAFIIAQAITSSPADSGYSFIDYQNTIVDADDIALAIIG